MVEQDRIVVVGCGTVGLPLAVALAVRGFAVCGYDTDREKILAFAEGRPGFIDPELAAAHVQARAAGRLQFTKSLTPKPYRRSFVVAVPTPAGDSRLDPRDLDAAIAGIAAVARRGDAIILRSTVPIGTTRTLAGILAERGVALDLAYCPDRTIGGRRYAELFEIPHIVAGIDERSRIRAATILSRLGQVVAVESLETAEAIKLFANVQREAMFGLANECALICERLGLDMYRILEAAAQGYPRHLLPRPGPVGGPCLPKDTALLVASLPDRAAWPQIALTAHAVNRRLLDCAREVVCEHLATIAPREPTVAILGVAFKGRPATADTRNSFAAGLGQALRAVRPSLEIRAWDPEVAPPCIAALGMTACSDATSAVTGANVVIFANDHTALAQLDTAALAAVVRRPALFYDLCGVQRACAPTLPAGVTLRVHGVGRPRHSGPG